jgi:hypothetical protein
MNDSLTWSLECVVWAWEKNVSISSNHKCCIEGGLINFNYKRNLASGIILAFFPSLVANVLQHNHLVEPGVEGRKVTSHTHIAQSLKEIGWKKNWFMFHEDWTHNKKWNPKAPQHICFLSSYTKYFKYNSHD